MELYQHRPQIAKTDFCVINVENSVSPAKSSFFWMPLLCRVPWAPCNGTTSAPPKLVVTLAPSNGTTSPTIAHYNGTRQWHHVHSPKIGRHPPPQPCNGTLRWHPAMAPRPLHPAMAPWCHVQSAKVVRRPPPLLEVRTPIAVAIWGIPTRTDGNVSARDSIQCHDFVKSACRAISYSIIGAITWAWWWASCNS